MPVIGRKAVAIFTSMTLVYLIFKNGFRDTEPGSSLLYWEWVFCALIIPAVIYHASMATSVIEVGLEIVARSLIFLLVGFASGCLIGFCLLLFNVDIDRSFPIGFGIGALGIAFLPPKLELLSAVAQMAFYTMNAKTRGPRGGVCTRCHGTSICQICLGRGDCGRCLGGRCQECSGTGYGSIL